MSFTALNTPEIAAAEPVKQELFQKVKDNFDDHESRLGSVETAVSTFDPIDFNFNGLYWKYVTPQTGVMYYRVARTIDVIAGRLSIAKAGTSGTTEVDALVSVGDGNGPYTSIFSTKPSVGFAAGDGATSTNGVLTSNPVTITAGSWIRVDLTAAQSGGDSAQLQLEFEV